MSPQWGDCHPHGVAHAVALEEPIYSREIPDGRLKGRIAHLFDSEGANCEDRPLPSIKLLGFVRVSE